MRARCEIELLAPAGKWTVLKEVLQAGADAVYLGGKRFNMRLLRPDFNFTDLELQDAVALCHDNGVRLYVTLNNLYHEEELPALHDYLEFLKAIQVDAVIIQDLALIEACRRQGISMHASVQMGVNNLETARLLEQSGVSRAVLSKNLALHEIRELRDQSSLGLEYFVHGDLCVAHTGQCLMSGLLFGRIGNRGECRKPCRWSYDLETAQSGKIVTDQYLLAFKDLCLYHCIPELVAAGVTSFKIEGRMREAEYLRLLVSCYRKAIDRYLDGSEPPTAGDLEYQRLYGNRIRDFTCGSLYGRPTISEIGLSGEREPAFPTAPSKLTRLQKEDYRQWSGQGQQLDLSVKVGSREGLRAALNKGVRTVVIPGTIYRGRGFSTLQDIAAALQEAMEAGTRAILELPRIITVSDRSKVKEIWDLVAAAGVNEVAVHDPGSLLVASRLGIKAGAAYGFNLVNSRAVEQVKAWGAVWASPSLEISRDHLQDMASEAPLPLEVVVNGPLCGMISDYCPVGSTDGGDAECCNSPCERDTYWLVDGLGQNYPLECDEQCRCYIYHPFELSLFTALPWLAPRISSARIEGDGYPPELLSQVIDIYQSAIQDISRGEWNQQANFNRLLDLFPHGLTTGPWEGPGADPGN